jgi:hypothetical protein
VSDAAAREGASRALIVRDGRVYAVDASGAETGEVV